MEAQPLILNVDLGDFFRQEVVAARAQVGVHMDEATEWYVVQLLCDLSHKDPISLELNGEPLALLYGRAGNSAAAERFALLKGLGDRALVMAGFFVESVERSLVDVDYYVTMGKMAYTDLAVLLQSQRRAEAARDLYRQLGRGFATYVDVLNQVSSRSRRLSGNDTDLLRLYDRYVKTGNVRVKKMLEGRGLSVTDAAPDGGVH